MLAVVLAGGCGSSGDESTTAEPPASEPTTENATEVETPTSSEAPENDLEEVEEIEIPIEEVSGITISESGELVQFTVIGDRSAELATADYSESSGIGEWEVSDLADYPDWGLGEDDSQLEAIAHAGGSTVALLREDPPTVIVGDTATGEVIAEIALLVPNESDLPGDDPSSRGEGLALLSEGRLLVAKEKDPPALFLFAPEGASAEVAPEDLLSVGSPWESPTGAVAYEAVAVWELAGEAADQLEDISDLAVGADGSLWLLSDESELLARLALDQPLGPGDRIGDLVQVLDLPKVEGKPEGVVVLGEGRFLVVLDREAGKNNGVFVQLEN